MRRSSHRCQELWFLRYNRKVFHETFTLSSSTSHEFYTRSIVWRCWAKLILKARFFVNIQCPPGVECVNGQCIFTTFDECTGGTIDTGFERCGNTNNGFCFKSIDFGSFCGSDIKCSDASKCFKSEDVLYCSQGFFCAENTSCGNVCVPSVKWYGQENRTARQLRELARSDTVTGPAGQKKWKGPSPRWGGRDEECSSEAVDFTWIQEREGEGLLRWGAYTVHSFGDQT
jgi:hypothetical protein